MQLFQAIFERNQARGLTKEQLKNIPDAQLSDEQFNDKTNCVICIVDFKRKEKVKLLPCKVSLLINLLKHDMPNSNRSLLWQHMYHKNCINNWLKTNTTCPVCRKDVNEPKANLQPGAEAQPNANADVIVIEDDGNVEDDDDDFMINLGDEQIFFVGGPADNEDAPDAFFEGFIHLERDRPVRRDRLRVPEVNAEAVIAPETLEVSMEDATAEEAAEMQTDDEPVPETPENEIQRDSNRAKLPREVRNLLRNSELASAFDPGKCLCQLVLCYT